MAGVRLLLLSDIHANFTALQAVLEDAEKRRYDQIIHLGDALGYGPHPHDVLEALRDLDARCILGNHDQMLLEYVDGTRPYKESVVASVLKWQIGRLTERDLRWIRTWRDGIDDAEVGARYRHGTPTSLDDYMDSVPAARAAFGQWQGMLAFVGHTHVPAVYATLNAPVGTIFLTLVRTPEAERDMAAVARARDAAERLWGMVEKQLGSHAYVCGDSLTLADIALGPYLHRWFALPIQRGAMPRLEAWYGRLRERHAGFRTHVAVPMS